MTRSEGMDAVPDPALVHHAWTQRRQVEPPDTALASPLLALHMSSDVDPVLPEQVTEARQVLRHRRRLVEGGATETAPVSAVQRQVVERFLSGRAAHFGADQCQPLGEAELLVAEGRDVFVVIKFMDEAPHLASTLHSLLNQQGIDLGRVVIVAVDNNSTDGSDRIVEAVGAANPTAARVVYLNQRTPGAGNAARFGVDRSIATVHRMCQLDGDWSRLQTAVIAVSDGDTVYHPRILGETLRVLEASPTVDAVMPFLTYKLTAGLRLFANHRPTLPTELERSVVSDRATRTDVDLSSLTAFDQMPRWARRRVDRDRMELGVADGTTLVVELDGADDHGRRFGLLRDPAGRVAYLMEDRTLVLAEAPLSGADAALVFLENGGVRRADKWRWHAVLGHDIFLRWAFSHMGLPERMVYPDTSDALKAVRCWAFAIGGQHQLRRPGLRTVTGSDYQSGRVLQAVGCTVRLGSADAYAETEIDRLIKMVRNLAYGQAVFYGQTRSSALERASGLYVHMTRIQGDIEAEVRGYADDLFEKSVFPERLLFALRWILQNALRFYAHDEEAREIVLEQVLAVMFGAEQAEAVEARWFRDGVHEIRQSPPDERLDRAEHIAEDVIAATYPQLMVLYGRTLRDFFAAQRVPADCYEWLLDGLDGAPSALDARPPAVDPAAVWDGQEFVIDHGRGQVVEMRRADDPR
ncbi:MAG: glycosyltransferase [Acidimicrobiales bacterium]